MSDSNHRRGTLWFIALLSIIALSSSDGQVMLELRSMEISWPEIKIHILAQCGNNRRYNLRNDNFIVKENGKEIPSFEVWCPDPMTHCCISVAFVLDKSAWMAQGNPQIIETEKKLTQTFLSAMNGGCDEATIIGSNHQQSVEVFMTNDQFLLSNGVRTLEIGGSSKIWDAASAGVNELLNNGTMQCRTVILMTNGHDDGSSSTVDDVIAHAIGGRIRVIVIGIGANLDHESDLRQLATDTGGKFYHNPTQGQLVDIYRELTTIIGSQSWIECVLFYEAQCPDGTRRDVEFTLKNLPDCSGTSTKTKLYNAPLDSTSFESTVVKALDAEYRDQDTIVMPIVLLTTKVNFLHPYSFDVSFDTSRIRLIGYNTLFASLDTASYKIERLANGYRITSRNNGIIGSDKIIGRLIFHVDSLEASSPVTIANWIFTSGCIRPIVQSGNINRKSSLLLTSPRGGERFCMGRSVTLQWEKTNIDSVDFDLTYDAGKTFFIIARGVTGSAFQWEIPDTLPIGWVRIRVRETNGASSNLLQYPILLTRRLIVTENPQNRNICFAKDSTAYFSASVSHAPDFYQWQKSTDHGKTWNDLFGEQANKLFYKANTSDQDAWFRARMINACDTVYSSSATLSIKPSPTIILQPADTQICEGESPRFTIQFKDAWQNVRWQVSKDSGKSFSDYPISVGKELELHDVTFEADNYRFRAIISNDFIAETSRVAVLRVQPSSAKILSSPKDQTRCMGDSVTFFAAAANAVRIEWVRNNVPIPGATTPMYHIPIAALSDVGSYAIRAYDTCGSIISEGAFLRVLFPPMIVEQPIDRESIAGKGVSFTVRASGTDLKYQWYRNGVALKGDTNRTLTIKNVQASDDGIYQVTVSNSCGSVTSRMVELVLIVTDAEKLSDEMRFELGQNYPNPFSENTTIRFQITDFGLQLPNHQGIEGTDVYNLKSVILKFYDPLGREVLDLSEQARNSTEIVIHRSQLPRAGVYFYRLTTPRFSTTKKMLLMD